MMYAVLFEDNPQLGAEVRQKHMSQHACCEIDRAFHPFIGRAASPPSI